MVTRLPKLCFRLLEGLWITWSDRFLEEAKRGNRTTGWCRSILDAIGVELEVEGDWPPGPTLVSSNHVSWLDGLVIGATVPCRFVAKRDIANWPVIGRYVLFAGGGGIFVNRSDPASVARGIASAVEALQAGRSVCWFPEGTTTNGSSLRDFSSSFFEAAIDAEAPVLPLAVTYWERGERSPIASWVDGERFAESFMRVLRARDIRCKIRVGNPIEPGRTTRTKLARETHRAVLKLADVAPYRYSAVGDLAPEEVHLVQIVTRRLESLLGREVAANMTFEEMNLDSLSAIPLLIELEQHIGIALDDATLLAHMRPSTTVEGLVVALNRGSADR